MASVKRVKYGPHFVTHPVDGVVVTKYFATARSAKQFAKDLEGGQVGQEQGEGPVRYEVCYRNAEGRGRSKRFHRMADATRFRTMVETQKNQGTLVDSQAGRVSFREYAETWISGRSLAANSRKRKEDNLFNHACAAVGDMQLRAIRAEDLVVLFNGLNHLSESTRLGVYTDVRAVFAFAKDNRRINEDPFTLSSVKSVKPRPRRKKVVPWTTEQVGTMFEALPERYRISLVLGFTLGLRQGEVFGLSPDDLDRRRQTATIRRQVLLLDDGLHFGPPKGGREREVPLPTVALNYLDEHLRQFPAVPITLRWSDPRGRGDIRDGSLATAPLVLTTRERNAVNRNTFNQNTWKPAQVACGLAKSRANGTHALRHYYASALLSAGESIRALSEYLGHHSPAYTLDTYTHLMPDSHHRSIGALDAAASVALGLD